MQHLVTWIAPRAGESTVTGDVRAKAIAIDYANVTLGLELALEQGNRESAERLGAGAETYWSSAGLWREGVAWMRRALELVDREERVAPTGGAELALRLDLLANLAHLHTLLEQHDHARALASRALSLAEGSDSPRHRGRAAHCAGLAAHGALDFESAERHFTATVAWMKEAGDREAMASALGNLAMTYAASARLPEAVQSLEEQLVIARELGVPHGISVVLNNLGLVSWALGRPVEALRYLDESLPIQRARGHALGTAICLNLIAEASIEVGELARARVALAESIPERLRMGQRVGVLSALRSVSRLVDREGDPALAAEVMGSVLAIRDSGVLLLQAEESAKMDAWREHLRGRLGDELLAEALARGASRSLDEAVEWVVSWLPAPGSLR